MPDVLGHLDVFGFEKGDAFAYTVCYVILSAQPEAALCNQTMMNIYNEVQ